MGKLPKRWDHGSVSYALDKFPLRHNFFSYNCYDLGQFEDLEKDDSLRKYKITESDRQHWKKYMSSDLLPFDVLNRQEAKRFINLIHYLDRNHLNAANLEKEIISFDYNDSLRMSDNIGFRTIAIDTSGYYGPDFFDVIDNKNGVYLLRKN